MKNLNKKFAPSKNGKKQAVIAKTGKQTIWFVLFKDSKINTQTIGNKSIFEVMKDHVKDLSVERYEPKTPNKEYSYSYRLLSNGNATGLTANSKTAIKGEINFSFAGESNSNLRADLIPKHIKFLESKTSSKKKEEEQEKKLVALMAAS